MSDTAVLFRAHPKTQSPDAYDALGVRMCCVFMLLCCGEFSCEISLVNLWTSSLHAKNRLGTPENKT